MNDRYHNILIVRTDRIGDVVLTTPAIAAVRRQFPNGRISVLVSLYTRDLVVGNPNINEVLVDDRKGAHRSVFGFWTLVGEIRKKNFDLVIVFHTKRRTNLLCFLAGIKERAGYRDKNFGFLLTRGIKDDRFLGEKHESQYCLDLLKQIDINAEPVPAYLPIQPEAARWAEDWLMKNRLSGLKIIAIHPGASDPTKCWPVESFARLIDHLGSMSGCQVVVFGAGETVALAQKLQELCKKPFIDLTGQTSVAQTAALFKHSYLLISNDSGPVHMAAAAGIYVISLFLRNQPGINPERWRPLGPRSYILSNKPQEAVRLDPSGQISSGSRDSIPVEDVLALARELLQKP